MPLEACRLGSWTEGQWSQASIHVHQLGHPKVGHLCSAAFTNQQDIVAGQVSVDDGIEVQVGQGKCHVMADVELDVVREGTRGSLQESGQTLIHQLHQKSQPS